jgi:adenylate cyclase
MTEIEAKFLLCEDGADHRNTNQAPKLGSSAEIRSRTRTDGDRIDQGYFAKDDFQEVIQALGLEIPFVPKELRLRSYQGEWLLTAKGEGGLVRNELEVVVKKTFFDQWWPRTEGRRICKIRWQTMLGEHRLEIDDYQDRDLLTAEIELASVDDLQSLPSIGKDVTDDPHYKNKNLAR